MVIIQNQRNILAQVSSSSETSFQLLSKWIQKPPLSGPKGKFGREIKKERKRILKLCATADLGEISEAAVYALRRDKGHFKKASGSKNKATR